MGLRKEKHMAGDQESETKKCMIWSAWRYAFVAVILTFLLSVWPQIDLWLQRGSEYCGAFASTQYDDSIYAAYLNGVTLGRPLASDPLIEPRADLERSKSYFSIQFVQPLISHLTIGLLGISTDTFHILYLPALAILSSLLLYYFIFYTTRDCRMALIGVLVTVCLGTVAGREGFMRHLLGHQVALFGIPFLRRYQPGISFPLYFVFVLVVFTLITKKVRWLKIYSIIAGMIFSVLVFGNLYLWTAALAWLVSFTVVWIAANRARWREMGSRIYLVYSIMIIALAIYGLEVRGIARATADSMVLESTHLPDLFRGPEIIALFVLLMLWQMWRKRLIEWKEELVCLTLSIAVQEFVMFNQQIVSGISIQPFHHEVFIGNYLALLSIVFVTHLYLKRVWHANIISPRVLFWVCSLTFVWGELEIRYSTLNFRAYNFERDEFLKVSKRMNEKNRNNTYAPSDREIVFSPDIYLVSDNLPAHSPQAILWGTYAYSSISLNEQERKERFFRQIYYSGMSPAKLELRLQEGYYSEITGLFGFKRAFPNHTRYFRPIMEDEIRAKVDQYTKYITQYSEREAYQPLLSWVIVPDNLQTDLSNLSCWYMFDGEERVGKYRIYKVKPNRPWERKLGDGGR